MKFGNKGALNEITATAWLLVRGYYVFRNVSAHGPVDLVAMKGSEVTLFDVKAATFYNGKLTPTYLTKEQMTLGVKPLVVFPDGKCKINVAKCHLEITGHTCLQCGEAFQAKRFRKFCKTRCSSTYHNALIRARRATNGP